MKYFIFYTIAFKRNNKIIIDMFIRFNKYIILLPFVF